MTAAHAVVLFSNFVNPANVSTVNGTQFTPGVTLKAVRFTMGNQAYALNSVQATLSLAAASGSGTALLSLYSDSGTGTPGSVLTTIGSQSVTNPNNGTPQNFTFSLASPFVLQRNTTYHLVMSNPSGTGIRWYRPNPTLLPTAQNGSGITNFAVPLSSNNGASWDTTSTINSRIEVSGVVVPEAGASILALTGVAIVGVTQLRRRK